MCNDKLEVLISTMHRNSLEFIDKMFQKADVNSVNILVINQTTKTNLLKSDRANIRVFNFFDKGISRSRNQAIKNATSKYALLTDDDVIFEPNFDQIILSAFKDETEAGFLVFKAKTLKGNDYRQYNDENFELSKQSIEGVMSIEIACDLEKIKTTGVIFDERFGIGSQFETAEEYLFISQLIKNNVRGYFCNQYIVSHSEYNSGKALGSDKIIYARSALAYKKYKSLAYFWVFKFVFFLVRKKFISLNDMFSKTKIGFKGIKDFKVSN